MRPHPKAPPRNAEANKRPRGGTHIYTDTLVKDRLVAVQQGKLAKNNGKEPARKRFNLGVAKNADKSIRPNAKLVKKTLAFLLQPKNQNVGLSLSMRLSLGLTQKR